MRLLVRDRQFIKVRLLLWVRSKCAVRGVSLSLWKEEEERNFTFDVESLDVGEEEKG